MQLDLLFDPAALFFAELVANLGEAVDPAVQVRLEVPAADILESSLASVGFLE